MNGNLRLSFFFLWLGDTVPNPMARWNVLGTKCHVHLQGTGYNVKSRKCLVKCEWKSESLFLLPLIKWHSPNCTGQVKCIRYKESYYAHLQGTGYNDKGRKWNLSPSFSLSDQLTPRVNSSDQIEKEKILPKILKEKISPKILKKTKISPKI